MIYLKLIENKLVNNSVSTVWLIKFSSVYFNLPKVLLSPQHHLIPFNVLQGYVEFLAVFLSLS